jgi:hypothetical protein
MPYIGAIRWGGWFSGSEWAENLDDPRWHDRLPFFASVGESAVEVVGDTAEVMRREIEYARLAGLSFWAFCYYDERKTELQKYNYGLHRYLAAPMDAPPGFSLILQGSHVGEAAGWPEFVERLVALFDDPRYMRVGADRPLLFLYDIASLRATFGSVEATRSALDELRAISESHGSGAPFLVAQNVAADAPDLGFDAFSAYTANGFEGQRELPYSKLAQANVDFWESERALGRTVIPLLNLGWDPRPRMNDAIWATAYGGQQSWYIPPRPEEIVEHIQHGARWVDAHATRDEERVLLLYAWNELDEGGHMLPTLAEGTARIEAVREAIDSSVERAAESSDTVESVEPPSEAE